MSSDKKLKIIHTEASPHWGGQEIRIFEEMKWFREQGHEMILVAPDNGTLYKRCKDEGFQVISVYFTKPRTLINIVRMLWVIWRIKPDVVGTHSSTDSWAALTASYVLGVKKRVRYRHVTTQIKNNLLNNLQYRILCNTVFTTAECISISIVRLFGVKKIYSFPTPITPPTLLPCKIESRKKMLKRLNLPENSILVGQVSVIRSWKGHNCLLNAFEEIVKTIPRIHLIFIGDGPHFNEIKSLIKSKKLDSKVHMLGHCEDIWPKIRCLDIMYLASTSNEAIPQSLLQSMHAEVPIIASNIGGIPEIIRHGTSGLLFERNDHTKICYNTAKLLTNRDLYNDLARNSKIFVNKINWKKSGNKITKIFHE